MYADIPLQLFVIISAQSIWYSNEIPYDRSYRPNFLIIYCSYVVICQFS